MTEIKCPMCGRPNPDTLEACQFCGARLKPLVIRPDTSFSESQQDSPPSLGEDAIEFLPDEEFPDWLEEEDSDETFDVRRTTQTGSLRDPLSWLDDMEANASAAAPPDEQQTPGESIQHVTGWLASLIGDDEPEEESAEEVQPAAEEQPFSFGAQEDEGLPDWLKGESAEEVQPAAGEQPFSFGAQEDEGLPDWLKGESAEEARPAGTSTPEAAGGTDELVFADTSSLPEMEIPDWLRPSEGGEEAPAAAEIEDTPGWLEMLRSDTDETSEESVPEWASAADEGTFAPAEETEGSISPFTLDESLEVELGALESDTAPDWLTGVTESAAEIYAEPEETVEEEQEPEAEIERANLPAWLQEMKPVEAVSSPQLLPEDEEAPPVRSGPLAGLRGVLPAAISDALGAKPATPSAKLSISEEQETHINRLRALLDQEEEAKEVPAPPPVTSQRLLRWFITLALLAAVVWPLLRGDDGNIIPGHSLPEVRDAYRQVDALPQHAPVLVAFDYQPAFGGEMEAVADALLGHLMLRGASLVSVSTQPEGLLLAEHALEGPARKHAYQAGKEYLNLGYIPGGVTGLSALADHMLLTLPQTPAGYPTQEQALMKDIRGVQDFALLVVLTDDPEVARAWIEQVGTRFPDLPLIMAVSAQAGPLVYPYYQGQVKGLVSGLTGGAAYERETGLGGRARKYGGALSNGTLLAVIFILFGSLAQYAWSAIRRQNPHPEGVRK